MKLQKMKLVLSSLLIVLLAFSSCKYEEGPKLSLKSKKSRLAGEYKYDKFVNDGLEIDLSNYSGLSIIFDKDGNITIKNSNNSTEEKGTYEFGDKKKTLKITGDSGNAQTWDILKLTKDEIWLSTEKLEWHLKE